MGQDLWRIVQDQESYYEKIDGLDYDEAFELNVLIEKGKPLLEDALESWDELIYTPFRYPLPLGVNFGSRFKAPGSEFNFLYAASEKDTSFAETAHHFLLGSASRSSDRSARPPHRPRARRHPRAHRERRA